MSNTTTMNLRDLFEEASLFQYSKSFYDLIRNSSELTLMEMYIDTQEYVSENTDLSNLSKEQRATLLTEAYNSNETDLQALNEKFELKKVFTFSRICELLKKIRTMLITFLKRLAKHLINFIEGKQYEIMLATSRRLIAKIDSRKLNRDEAVKALSRIQPKIDEALAKEKKSPKFRLLPNTNDELSNSLNNLYRKLGSRYTSKMINDLLETTKWMSRKSIVESPDFIGNIEVIDQKLTAVLRQFNDKMMGLPRNNQTNNYNQINNLKKVGDQLDELNKYLDVSSVKTGKWEFSKETVNDSILAMEKSNEIFTSAMTVLSNQAKNPSGDTTNTDGGKGRIGELYNVANTGFGAIAVKLSNFIARYNDMTSKSIVELKNYIATKSLMFNVNMTALNALNGLLAPTEANV